MTRGELASEHAISIEPYGGGFIVADYSGRRADRTGKVHEAVYAGLRGEWVQKPLGISIPFLREAEAMEFAVAAIP